jgi:hypothetical protein
VAQRTYAHPGRAQLFIFGAAPWVVGAATRYDDQPLPAPARAVERPPRPALAAVVGAAPAGRPLPAGFLGLSFEYGALKAATRPEPMPRSSPRASAAARIGRPAARLTPRISRAWSAVRVGNEPDVYGVFPWYMGRHGRVFARDAAYDLNAYVRQIARWAATLPRMPLAGRATAKLPWMVRLPALLRAAPRLKVVTVHCYALKGCQTNPGSPAYPSIANLLSDRASSGLADALRQYIAAAHADGLQFRVDELNSAALAGCLGRTGISDTFASALWMVDALFNMASVGVDGVNVHSLPGAAYEPFTFERTRTGWRGSVRPDYYGMLMFAHAFPPGARLLPVRSAGGPVKVWATRAANGTTRVVLINKDSREHEVALTVDLPRARIEWLRAPSAGATGGVTLGGSAVRPNGVLPTPRRQPISPRFGRYRIDLPPASAALLTRY